MKPRAQTDHRCEPRRRASEVLAAAEGVLVTLRHCSLDEASMDIVQTAKRHNVATMGLADAPVAVAENDVTRDFDDAVVAVVGQAWGALLGQPGEDRDRQRGQWPQPTMTVCTSGGPSKLIGHQR